jgi:hypothetical protein
LRGVEKGVGTTRAGAVASGLDVTSISTRGHAEVRPIDRGSAIILSVVDHVVESHADLRAPL